MFIGKSLSMWLVLVLTDYELFSSWGRGGVISETFAMHNMRILFV